MKSRRTIEIVGHVVLARPQQFDRHADLFRNRRSFDYVIVIQTPAETATGAQQMNRDVFLIETESTRDEVHRVGWSLGRRPDFQLALLEVRRTVLRLQRGVRQEWIRVGRLYDFRGIAEGSVDIAICTERSLRLFFGQRFSLLREAKTRLRGSSAFVPFHLQLLASGFCLPPTIGNDRDATEQPIQIGPHAFDDERMTNSRHRLNGIEVRRSSFAAKHRTLFESGPQHSRHAEIDPVEWLASYDR